MAREMRLHASSELSTVQLFLAYITCALGGTALSSFLLGQPPGWLAVDAVCLCYVLCFIAMRYEPFASRFMHVFRVPLLLPWLVFMQDIGFSHAVTSFGVDRCLLSPSSLYAAASPHHAAPSASFPFFHPPTHLSFFSAIAVGWLSGTGGGLLRFGLRLLQPEWQFRFPSEVLAPPSVHVRLAFWCGLLYYALCNPHAYLPATLLSRADAKLVVMAIVVSQVSGKRLVNWLMAEAGGAKQVAVPAVSAGKGLSSNGVPAQNGDIVDGEGDEQNHAEPIKRRRSTRAKTRQ